MTDVTETVMAPRKDRAHSRCWTHREDGAVCGRSKGHDRQDDPKRSAHFDPGRGVYWPAKMPILCWVQAEPRRKYQTEFEGETFNLGYRGRGTAPEAGWYLLGGFDGEGNVFMGKTLRAAADEAGRQVIWHITTRRWRP